MSIDLLSALEEHFPINREVHIDGFPHPLWLWRLSTEQVLAASKLPRSTQAEVVAYYEELCVMSVGDEKSPGLFDSDRGRAVLHRNPNLMIELGKQSQEFNELNGPSDARKKSSETTSNSETCSQSPERSDSTTPNESSSQSDQVL